MGESTGRNPAERVERSDYFKFLVEKEVEATLSTAWARYKAVIVVMVGAVTAAAALIGWHYVSLLELQSKIETDRGKLEQGLIELGGLEKRLEQLKHDAGAAENDVRRSIADLSDDIRNTVRDTREIAKLEAQQRQATVQFFDLVNKLNQQQVEYVDRKAADVKLALDGLDTRISRSDTKLEELRQKGEKIIDDFKRGVISAPQAANQLEPLPTTMPSFLSAERNALIFMGEHPKKKLDEDILIKLKSGRQSGE